MNFSGFRKMKFNGLREKRQRDDFQQFARQESGVMKFNNFDKINFDDLQEKKAVR